MRAARSSRFGWARRHLLAKAALLTLASGSSAAAAIDPQLTGEMVLLQLEAAQRDLSQRVPAARNLASQLDEMGTQLRRALEDDGARPIGKLDDRAQALSLQAYAAARQAQSWLSATAQCSAADVDGSLAALDLSVRQLASAPAKADRPVIVAVEDGATQRPLFALREGSPAVTLSLSGTQLHDPRCEAPVVTALAADGAVLPDQPRLKRALPDQIDLEWPSSMPAGSYSLRLRSQRRGRLLMCTDAPEALAAIQVLPRLAYSIEYLLEPRCGDTRAAAVSGTLPSLKGGGDTVAQRLDVSACAAVSAYTLTARVTTTTGQLISAGPVTQSAMAGISLGVADGVLLSWDAHARLLAARSVARSCAAVQ